MRPPRHTQQYSQAYRVFIYTKTCRSIAHISFASSRPFHVSTGARGPVRKKPPGNSDRHGPSTPTCPKPSKQSTSEASPRLPPREQALTISELSQQRHRKWPLVGAGVAVFALSLYSGLAIASYFRARNDPCDCDNPFSFETGSPTGRPSALELGAATSAGRTDEKLRTQINKLDHELDRTEFSGITKLRKRIASLARGHVLEVAVGTGRNVAYLDWEALVSNEPAPGNEEALRTVRSRRMNKLFRQHLNGQSLDVMPEEVTASGAVGRLDGEVLSYTGVDVSPDKMVLARQRLRASVPGLSKLIHRLRTEPMPQFAPGAPVLDVLDGRVRLLLGDVQTYIPRPPELGVVTSPPAKFDTVIESFGLCSVPDPVAALCQMAAAVQPVTGRILLLEHGRGWSDFFNRYVLDRGALGHFRRYGCWWNRNIEGAIEEARRRVPGLEVVRTERPRLHLGTTMLYVLKIRGAGEESGEEASKSMFDRVKKACWPLDERKD